MDPRQYKATISQNKAINKFLEEGYYVFTNVCEQGPIDIIVVNPKNGRAHYLDIKTSKGSRIVNGKTIGGNGAKLKTYQKGQRGVEERAIYFWPGAVARELSVNFKEVEPLFTVHQPWTLELEPALERVLVPVPE
jgi:hypothetical protein